jgi:putative ABC transport system permease protein
VVGTALLFGVLPALHATGTRVMRSLRESGRGGTGGIRAQRTRSGLVVVEIALAVVLLVGAGLLIRSFLALTRIETGFDPANALTFRVSPWGPGYGEPQEFIQFHAELERRLRALPGVSEVGAAQVLPMMGSASVLGPFAVEGQAEVPAGLLPEIRVTTVTPQYFAAIGARLAAGRMFDGRDGPDAPPVVVMNRTAAERWFAGGAAAGRRVVLGGTTLEVVGIVHDVLQRQPSIPVEPEMYLPYTQNAVRTMRVVVRGPADAGALAARIRTEVRELDSQLPVENIEPLASVVSAATARPRFYTALLTIFAAVALALAAVGIFGVMSYTVAQRSREIGIRMALGADTGNVVGMVVRGAMKVAVAGILTGVAGALAAGGVLRSQLFGVEPTDPVTLAGVLLLLLSSAFLASYIPARRAARTQPTAALREG